MPRPCPRTVDAPLRVLGLELEDWAVVASVIMFFVLAWTPAVAALVSMPVVIGLRTLKRGQPPGAMLHRLWLWGVVAQRGPLPPPPREGQWWSPWR